MIYLASPYSHPDAAIRQQRFENACDAAAILMRDGKVVFSPIAHTHPIAVRNELPLGWEFWEAFDRTFVERCDSLCVLMLPGWEQSRGVMGEIAIAEELCKPVTFMEWGVRE